METLQEMIDQLNKHHISIDNEMQNILSTVDRKLFSPTHAKHFSYSLNSIDMGNGRWIQSPLMVVKIAQLLELKKSDKVLEIGCSSGYQTAILSKLCHQIYTIDCDETILEKAKKSFENLNLYNIETILAIKEKEWKVQKIFDRIVFSFSIDEVPNIYFERLAEDGIIIAPLEVRDNYQILTKYHKKNGVISIEDIEQCLFVSMSDISKKCDETHLL